MWIGFKVGHHADETLEIDLASQLLLKISVGKTRASFRYGKQRELAWGRRP